MDRRRALAGGVALAATSAAHPLRAQGLDTVNAGKLIGVSDCPFYIADKKGFFRDAGLNVVWTTFPQSQAMVAPLAQGQLEVMGGSLSANGTIDCSTMSEPFEIKLPDPSVWHIVTPSAVQTNGRVDAASRQFDCDVFKQLGLIDKPVSVSASIDMTFVDHANRELGPYRAPKMHQ